MKLMYSLRANCSDSNSKAKIDEANDVALESESDISMKNTDSNKSVTNSSQK